MRTLRNDTANFLEWAYGAEAKWRFFQAISAGQRDGQAFMNTLYVHDMPEYDRLTGSLVDPFNRDENLLAAIDKLTTK